MDLTYEPTGTRIHGVSDNNHNIQSFIHVRIEGGNALVAWWLIMHFRGGRGKTTHQPPAGANCNKTLIAMSKRYVSTSCAK